MVSMVGEIWRGQTYKAIESITVSANCKVRRIFTMKCQPPDNAGDEGMSESLIGHHIFCYLKYSENDDVIICVLSSLPLNILSRIHSYYDVF